MAWLLNRVPGVTGYDVMFADLVTTTRRLIIFAGAAFGKPARIEWQIPLARARIDRIRRRLITVSIYLRDTNHEETTVRFVCARFDRKGIELLKTILEANRHTDR
jgi:hypothetical protein